MNKLPLLNRGECLDNIRRNLDSLTLWNEKRPDVLAKVATNEVVTNRELEQLEEIITNLVAAFETEMEMEGDRAA